MTSNVVLFEERCDCLSRLPRHFDFEISRVAVIGDSSVGKTCLVGRWIKGQSIVHEVAETEEHLEDIYHKVIELDAFEKSDNYGEYSNLVSEALIDENKLSENIYRNKAFSNSWYDTNRKLDAQVIDVTDFDVSDYSDMRHLQIEQADGFILCYDTTNPTSLADMSLYQRMITRIKGDDVPIICLLYTSRCV